MKNILCLCGIHKAEFIPINWEHGFTGWWIKVCWWCNKNYEEYRIDDNFSTAQ